MNYKKIIFVGTIWIFLISFIIHNMYTWFPSDLTFIFFPINESIWEHQKMIFDSYLIWGIIEYFWLKKNNLKYTNAIPGIVTSAFFNILIFLLIYTPIFILFGHNMIVTLVIYFVTIVVSQIVNYVILTSDEDLSKLNILSIIAVITLWIMFAYLSYNPIHYKPLFYDYDKGVYGKIGK